MATQSGLQNWGNPEHGLQVFPSSAFSHGLIGPPYFAAVSAPISIRGAAPYVTSAFSDESIPVLDGTLPSDSQYLIVNNDPAFIPGTPTGWTQIARFNGNPGTAVSLAVWKKDVTQTSGNIAIDNISGNWTAYVLLTVKNNPTFSSPYVANAVDTANTVPLITANPQRALIIWGVEGTLGSSLVGDARLTTVQADTQPTGTKPHLVTQDGDLTGNPYTMSDSGGASSASGRVAVMVLPYTVS